MKPQDFQSRDGGRGGRAFLPNHIICLIVLRITFVLLTGGAGAAELPDASPEALKKLSLEELLNLNVTSVAKHAQKLSQTPSA
ncbi:MAG TPA: hypothetical protein VL527_11245, partial [Dongiaceae bacterium]|nr:hypothetical protein [Dongiaceae bacterium]